MKIEIWSDIMCPFCYIGKRKFEHALEQFEKNNPIIIEWKSFQLMPGLKTDPVRKSDEFLAEEKGVTIDHARAMNAHASQMAKDVGLVFDFDKAIPANTFNAHRLIHMAKAHGKQHEAEEVLFRSYFTDGQNLDDIETLTSIVEYILLNANDVRAALKSDKFADDVRNDIYEAQQIGVRGVPFFVFDRKYAVSGAQPSDVFIQVLDKSFSEWRKENPTINLEVTTDGSACAADGRCD